MKTGSRSHIGGILILVVILTMTLMADGAQAWGKKKPKKEPPAKAVNLNKYPSMTVKRGVLSKDIYGNWELGKTPLVFNRHSRITAKEESFGQTGMSEGREALVMGYNRAGSFVVHRVTMVSIDKSIERGTFNAVNSDSELDEMKRSTPQ